MYLSATVTAGQRESGPSPTEPSRLLSLRCDKARKANRMWDGRAEGELKINWFVLSELCGGRNRDWPGIGEAGLGEGTEALLLCAGTLHRMILQYVLYGSGQWSLQYFLIFKMSMIMMKVQWKLSHTSSTKRIAVVYHGLQVIVGSVHWRTNQTYFIQYKMKTETV